MAPIRKAYSYIRFSTPEQAKGDSLNRQKNLAKDFCVKHNLTLDTELKLQDLGVSAYRGANLKKKSALGMFLRLVEDGLIPKGSVLILESMDRMSRKTPWRTMPILQQIINGGVAIGFPPDKIIDGALLDSPAGTWPLMELMLTMARANEESEKKKDRNRKAWETKRAKVVQEGELLTRRVPGWIAVEDGKPVLIPERAKIVKRIFRDFLKGHGKEKIAVALNSENVPVFGRAEQGWSRSYILKILTNPAVTGVLTPHADSYDADDKCSRVPQQSIENYYPRVIDPETFAKVQAVPSAAPGRLGIAHLLANLAKCPVCGATMTRFHKGNGARAALVCGVAKSHGKDKPGCIYHSVRVDWIERAIYDNIAVLTPPHGNPDIQKHIDGLVHELSGTEKLCERLADDLMDFPSKTLATRLQRTEAKADAIRVQLAELRAEAALSESKLVIARGKRLTAVLEESRKTGDKAAANTALRENFDRVIVDYQQGVLRMQWRHGGETELPFAWPVEEQPGKKRKNPGKPSSAKSGRSAIKSSQATTNF